ncbi:DUF397 domain-containing protein [Streptomyces sp. NPDC059853]|uniref:DUF397 domain-containing protein n=1 Tax=Streptomyces sp. NPDC059853 TaxID=3346973 RepID=UPI00365E15A0
MSDVQWQKSSYSTEQANCIEIATVNGSFLMRESDSPEAIVETDHARLATLLDGVKRGAFDPLIS